MIRFFGWFGMVICWFDLDIGVSSFLDTLCTNIP